MRAEGRPGVRSCICGESIAETPGPVTTSGASTAQDRLEPIPCEAAGERGADLHLGLELLGFEQDAEEIRAELRARYPIAAGGADSAIRERLGIPRGGVGHLRTVHSIPFRRPEADEALRHGIQRFDIEQPGSKASLPTCGDGRRVLMFDDDRERDHTMDVHHVGHDLVFPDDQFS